jgi:hypothetical protein
MSNLKIKKKLLKYINVIKKRIKRDRFNNQFNIFQTLK